jgi:hypothetical protein
MREMVEGHPARLSRPLKSTAMMEVKVKATITAAEKRLWAVKTAMVIRCRMASREVGEVVFITSLLSTLCGIFHD